MGNAESPVVSGAAARSLGHLQTVAGRPGKHVPADIQPWCAARPFVYSQLEFTRWHTTIARSCAAGENPVDETHRWPETCQRIRENGKRRARCLVAGAKRNVVRNCPELS